MKTAMTVFCLALFMGGTALPTLAQTPPDKAPYHVMWTTAKGKAKCKNKPSQEKAEKCAAKLRSKPATGVQVMAGKCSSM